MWQSSDTLYDPRLARGGDIEKVKGECEMKEIVIPEMNETEKPVDVGCRASGDVHTDGGRGALR